MRAGYGGSVLIRRLVNKRSDPVDLFWVCNHLPGQVGLITPSKRSVAQVEIISELYSMNW